jgi:hypothetical protein
MVAFVDEAASIGVKDDFDSLGLFDREPEETRSL